MSINLSVATMATNDSTTTAFRPTSAFQQTCGACGCVFSVEIESRRGKDDQQTYSCPQCSHHLCSVASPRPPRVTVITRGTQAPSPALPPLVK